MTFEWKPYVPVAERRRRAASEAARRRKKGGALAPVLPTGPSIARTFWGKAWCDNLERYSDYANRLPRGRTYVRNGSVIDLRITAGEITALVSGSSVYEVSTHITALAPQHWESLCSDCAGAIDSLVELLQARFSKAVMERMCRQDSGLFPSPREIRFNCSCPDWADMCKHVAAVLYGVGARLDRQPELLFQLRNVDHTALIATAGSEPALGRQAPVSARVLDAPDLSVLFGIEIATSSRASAPPEPVTTAPPASPRRATGKRSAKRTDASVGARRPAVTKRAASTKQTKAAPTKPAKARASKTAHKRSRPA